MSIKNENYLICSEKEPTTKIRYMKSRSYQQSANLLRTNGAGNQSSGRLRSSLLFKGIALAIISFFAASFANNGIGPVQAMDFSKPVEFISTSSCSVYYDNVSRRCSGVTLRMFPSYNQITYHLDNSDSITFAVYPSKDKSDGAYLVAAILILPQGDIYYAEKGHFNLNSVCIMPVKRIGRAHV